MKPLALLALLLTVSACSGKDTPSGFTSPGSTQTRVMSLVGNLTFGTVPVGTAKNAGFTISNQGTSALTITGLSGPCAAMLKSTFLTGVLQPNQVASVIVTFTPTLAADCSGLVTILADQTSGTNTMPISAVGTLTGVPLFSMAGIGDTVFDMPLYVARVRVTGTFTGGSSNFIVKVGGRLLVNELVGTSWGQTNFAGTYVTTGGVTEIVSSSGVSWSFTEQR